MGRRANAIPPKAAEPRKRCTRGWRGQSCKRRTCEVCGVVWARDWRRVLFEALQAPGVPVVLSAVTPPGPRRCRGTSGTALISGRIGIALGSAAGWRARRWRRGRRTSRSGGSGSTTVRGTRASARWVAACRSRHGRGSRRREGRGTCTRSSMCTRRATSRSQLLPATRGAAGSPAWVRVRGREGGQEHAGHVGRPGGGVPVELLRSWQGLKGDAAGECAEPAPAANADLGLADSHAADRRDDAEPPPLSAAVGGAHGAASSAVVVGRRARSDRALAGPWPVRGP